MSIWCYHAIWCFIYKLVLSLFGVMYLATSFGQRCFGVTHWSGHALCPYWCFINVTIVFGVIAILAKCYLVIHHIINTVVSVTFLFAVLAFSPRF